MFLVVPLGMVETGPVPTKLVLKGYEDRTNDVLYAPPNLLSNDLRTMVIYFGGDIQVFIYNLFHLTLCIIGITRENS